MALNKFQRQILVSALFILVAVSTSWLAELAPLPDLAQFLASHLSHPANGAYLLVRSAMAILLFTILVASSYHAPRFAAVFQGVRTLQKTSVTGHRVLVVALSDHNEESVARLKAIAAGEPFSFTFNSQERQYTLSGDWNKDKGILTETNGFNLAICQLLRGAAPHYVSGNLNRIYLIQSKQSAKQVSTAKSFLELYLKGISIEVGDVVDFGDIDALHTMYKKIIEKEENQGVSANDIIIDITSGTKAVSIAGAVATVSNRVKFQYVPNNWETGAISQYDMVNTSGANA